MGKVMMFGTFDILHAGHIALFEQASMLGNTLVVVVARDNRVDAIKGSLPIHTEQERMHMLKQVKIIDQVILGDEYDVYRVIQQEKPDTIALGYDQIHYTENLAEKIKKFQLETNIVRLKPYNEHIYKSTIIKEKLFSQI